MEISSVYGGNFLYRDISIQELAERISSTSGRNIAEIRKLIEDKKNKFSGLLTDSGAAFMIAKELGIDLNNNSSVQNQEMKLSGLKEGDNNFDVKVRVMHIFQPKHFEKNGKKGVLCNLVVADDTEEMRDTQVFIAIRKAYTKDDLAFLRYNLFIQFFGVSAFLYELIKNRTD